MDSLTTAVQWMLQRPWMVLGVLVLLGVAILWMGRSRTSRHARYGRGPLLRSRQEQKRFSPLSTVYSPKRYRRERPPRK